MENIKFPKNPTKGQLHEGYIYINGKWVILDNNNQYELIRAATKQGMKDYEHEKEVLTKTATKVMIDSGLMDKLEQYHKEHEDLITTIEFVLDYWYVNDKNQEHRNVLKKFLERLKNYNYF